MAEFVTIYKGKILYNPCYNTTVLLCFLPVFLSLSLSLYIYIFYIYTYTHSYVYVLIYMYIYTHLYIHICTYIYEDCPEVSSHVL